MARNAATRGGCPCTVYGAWFRAGFFFYYYFAHKERIFLFFDSAGAVLIYPAMLRTGFIHNGTALNFLYGFSPGPILWGEKRRKKINSHISLFFKEKINS